ncbi:unnamed protein product [Rhizoctonia solani]|uniref:Iminophenyl-pyruvate dimer synthase domain-containing protein n=1 Tax=Rhizoctonia solani TaxID=456999 RepID=A0A8H3CT55_9AGAM|nr:unnamed protein product [Rhizoctonia solani]
MSHLVEAKTQPIYRAPTAPPREWTLTSLRQHLQTAVILELYTIPLYLFASYSVKASSGEKEKDAKEKLKGMFLNQFKRIAGNILCALRGHPQVYGEPFSPKYPSEILYEGVLMTLAPATKTQIQNFAEVEQPVQHRVNVDEDQASTRTLGQYESIGQFYESLKQGLIELHKRLGDDIFDKDSKKRQWQGRPGTPLIPIADLQTALDKLELIIEQGEGGPSEPETESHFGVFTSLSKLDLDVWPSASNPKTSQFKGREKCYPYSYLLWTLEAGWTYGGPDEDKRKKVTGNLHPLMVDVLAPLAEFLVEQPLQTFNKNAAPPFNLYIYDQDVSPLQELKGILDDAVKAYPGESAIQGARDAVFQKLYDLGDV